MSKFKVGDMVVIANPYLDSQECYRGFVRRIHSIDAYDSYYFEDIKDEDGDMVPWEENELELVEPVNDRVESLYPKVPPMLYNFTLSDAIENTYNKVYERILFDKECSDDDLKYCMNDITTTNTYVENKEEKNMNKVVTLWYERKRKSIEKKYDKLREEFGKKQYGIIESFNELVDKFNKDLDGLFQFDKASEQFVLVNNAPNNVIKYKIDVNKLDDEFNEMYRDEIRKAYKKIDDTREEVEAQLSLSDDLKYQQEVLERYNIISKKTKKISD